MCLREVVVLDHLVRADEDYGGGLNVRNQGTVGDLAYAQFAHLDFSDGYTQDAPRLFARFSQIPPEKGGLGALVIPPDRAEEDYDYGIDYYLDEASCSNLSAILLGDAALRLRKTQGKYTKSIIPASH